MTWRIRLALVPLLLLACQHAWAEEPVTFRPAIETNEKLAAIREVAFCSDETLLGVGTFFDESAPQPISVRIWDVRTGKRRGTLSGHANGAMPVAFSPTGKLLPLLAISTGSNFGDRKI